jgi:FkbH-like protein
VCTRQGTWYIFAAKPGDEQVLKHDRSELDYFQLVKKARRLQPVNGQRVRLALLADVSTQHLVPLLRVLFASNGVDAEIYEGAYGAVELEAYDAGSGLYAFQPQAVVILQSTGKLAAAYHDYPDDRGGFVKARAARSEAVWRAILERTGAHVVQSTFVLPLERPYGSFGLKVADTLQGAARELNRELALRAREVPGVLLCDLDDLAGWIGRRAFFDEKLWALSKTLCRLEFLPDVAQSIVDVVLAASGRAVKCLVLDLDNTLWGGVVGDDGIEGIQLGDSDESGAFRSLQLFLRDLWRRGVVLAVCSKNDEALARRVFREHPGMVLREEHIAVFVANWEDKATNIRRIREKLNIGFDTMAFLDDNPFERNMVRQLLPEVIVPELPEDPALYLRALSELNLFETGSASELDARRGALYQEQGRRDEERTRFGGVEDYLRSLQTTALSGPFEPRQLPRIAQLIQRSNQFNLTTRRYSEAECAAMMRDEKGFHTLTLTVQDRFGDFGLVNLAILKKAGDTLEIDTFLMSCRVLQRGVEQLAMNCIFGYAVQHGFQQVVGRYIPTAKNAMVKVFYEQFGFQRVDAPGSEGVVYRLPAREYAFREVFIRNVPAATTPDEGEARP